MKNYYAWWETDDSKLQKETAVLKNININLELNNLYIVIGKVRSGKSSLLLTILNEIPRY